MRGLFFITYETVTPESAEHGDAAERGFLHPNGGRDSLETMGERDAYAFPLSSVPFHLGYVEDCGSWFAETGSDREDYRTGAVTRYSLHPPHDITPSSYRRLARALGVRS